MRIVLNPNDREVKTLQIALEENDGYCPCVPKTTEEFQKDPTEFKCMCKAFRDQIKNKIPGACHCGLWIAVED